LRIGRITTRQPVSHAGERLAEKRNGWLRAVQSVGPAAECGGIGQAVRVFERRCGFFPGAVLRKALLQCLRARQQTVVRVRERKQREEGEGPLATTRKVGTRTNLSGLACAEGWRSESGKAFFGDAVVFCSPFPIYRVEGNNRGQEVERVDRNQIYGRKPT
jgi:hypothetical protein